MPRHPRICLPGIPSHAYVRGNDHQVIFRSDSDRLAFYRCLLDASRKRGLAIHAYVFMTNHIHLLVSGESSESLGLVIQDVGRSYVQNFNNRHGRTGTLWEGRFKSCLVDSESYYFNCHGYIEQNPVRARMVECAAQYPWSSHRHYAHGVPDDLVTRHSVLDPHVFGPLEYRSLFAELLPAAVVDEIRLATRIQAPLGNAAFRNRIAELTGTALEPGKRGWTLGRPRRGVVKQLDVLTPIFEDL